MYFETKLLEFNKVLEQIIPYCQTNIGKEKIKEITPSCSLSVIESMLDEVEEAFNATVKLQEIPLGGFKNVYHPLIRSQIGGVLTCEELLDCASFLYTSRNVLKYYKDLSGIKMALPNLDKYFQNISSNKKIEEEITGAIGPDLKINDNASMELFKIRRKLKMEETHLRNFMNSCLQSKANMLQETIVASRDGHLTLPIKAEYKNQIKGILRDSSASGTTYFIEPEEAYKITCQIEIIKNEEKKEEEQIIRGLSQLIASISEEMLLSYENLLGLDLIFAKAKYALNHNMTKPIINEDGIIEIKNGAHPLIDEKVVVKNDVSLGKDYDTIIITGPNTGGKTVLLKMVGLITLMMQSGLYVPCKEGTKLNVFDNVFSDIGDEQSIEQSLSTFSSHMTNIANIVNKFTYNSLVLLDEVGSGTDPKEGASLAIAIIDYFTKKGGRIITTTHYSDLKAFAYNNPKIINASVEFKTEDLMPTYKLQIGVAGRSNAILISKRLGLKDEILEEAKRVFDDSMSDTSSLINKIDEENEKISNIKATYEHKISEYNRQLDALNKEKHELEANYDSIIKKATDEANQILLDAKEKSNSIISELNKLKDEEYFKEHKLASVKHDISNLTALKKDDNLFDDKIVVGDYVYIKSYQTTGEVLKIKGDKYTVRVGKFEMSFNRNEISFDSHRKIEAKKPAKKPSVLVTKTSSAKMTLDLRGYRYDEVKPAVEKFIDDAYLANMPQVNIIHGFGTGAVREALYKYLKTSSYVKSYRFGGEGEGLNGCTVVYLK